MPTIQIVLDAPLLKAADQAARPGTWNRSARILDALREHPRRPHVAEVEERDRRGDQGIQPSTEDAAFWEKEAVWPEAPKRRLC